MEDLHGGGGLGAMEAPGGLAMPTTMEAPPWTSTVVGFMRRGHG
jgi:hypothetical protein